MYSQIRYIALPEENWVLSRRMYTYKDELSFENKKCTRCGFCIKVCPKEALAMSDEGFNPKITMKEELCAVCGLCASVCTHIGAKALHFKKVDLIK